MQRLKALFSQPVIIFFILSSLALFLRLSFQSLSPPSPYWEEVALGYDAFSLLQTGQDRLGNSWPSVAFVSFGDYKPALYYYFLLPSLKIWGLSVWAVRFPAALSSALSVGLVYLIARRWLKPTIAIWSGILLAIQPWSWQVGSAGFEVNLAVLFILLGIYLLSLAMDNWLNKKSIIFSVLAAGSFVLSMYAYHSARLWAPTLALGMIVIYALSNLRSLHQNWQKLWWWLPSAGLALALLSPLLQQFFSPVVQQRLAETSFFSTLEPVQTSNYLKLLAGNTWLARIIFHRYWFWIGGIFKNYLSHFEPSFLFGLAEKNPRHLSQLWGALYPWEFFTLVAGISSGWYYFKNKTHWWWLIIWTLLIPIPAAMTKTTPHALRTLALAPALAIWSGIGLYQIKMLLHQYWPQVPQKVMVWLYTSTILGIMLISSFILGNYLVKIYPVRYSSEWQYGYAELYHKLDQLQQENEQVFVSREKGRPAMYYFFYQQVDPRLVQTAVVNNQLKFDQKEILLFGNWHFEENTTSPGLHAVSAQDNHDLSQEIIITIYDLNQQPVWLIYRVK